MQRTGSNSLSALGSQGHHPKSKGGWHHNTSYANLLHYSIRALMPLELSLLFGANIVFMLALGKVSSKS